MGQNNKPSKPLSGWIYDPFNLPVREGTKYRCYAQLRHVEYKNHSHVVCKLAMDDQGKNHYLVRDIDEDFIGRKPHLLPNGSLYISINCPKRGCRGSIQIICDLRTGQLQYNAKIEDIPNGIPIDVRGLL